MKVRKIPLRQCIGCMNQKSKKELIRIVKTKDGEIKIDKTSKAAGRGAYICDNVECFNKLKKKRGLNKTFQQEVNEEIYDNLRKELTKDEK
ncbi:YlxR family protein [Lutibacter sp. B2]|nr:YlxR family protein [Lutibacter sp. B2]